MDKRVSYGVMRPGFNTPMGRELFRICEDWIGGLCMGVCSMVCLGDVFVIFLLRCYLQFFGVVPTGCLIVKCIK